MNLPRFQGERPDDMRVESFVRPKELVVVYHLPKKSGNFGWNVNGKMNFVSPNGNFLGKTGFLERQSKIPERNLTSSRSYAIFYLRHVGCVNMAAAESSVFQCARTSKVDLVSRKCDLNSAIA